MDVAGEYKNLDQIRFLEKTVVDLRLLSKQQTNTISSLEQESSLKSQKILELEKLSGRATVSIESDNVFRPKMHLSNLVPGQKFVGDPLPSSRPTVPAPGTVEAAKMAEQKMLALQGERNFWRRHFLQADDNLKEMKRKLDERKNVNAAFSPLKEINPNIDLTNPEAEGNYIRALLSENIELKEKLAKMSKSGGKMVKIVESSEMKENLEHLHQPHPEPTFAAPQQQNFAPRGPKVAPRAQNAALRGNMRARFVPPRYPGPGQPRSFAPRPAAAAGPRIHTRPIRANLPAHAPAATGHGQGCEEGRSSAAVELEHLAEHNKCLINQVYSLKKELESRAAEINCCCRTRSGVDNGRPNGPEGVSSSSAPCDRCYRLTCRNEGGVRFEERMEEDQVHLCQHIKCLQRQVCHLQYQAREGQTTRQELQAGQFNLDKANKEVRLLSEKCDKLLEQKKEHLEKISTLSRKVEALLGPPEGRVRHLIEDIEVQRDRYKQHVETLINQLQTNTVNPRIAREIGLPPVQQRGGQDQHGPQQPGRQHRPVVPQPLGNLDNVQGQALQVQQGQTSPGQQGQSSQKRVNFSEPHQHWRREVEEETDGPGRRSGEEMVRSRTGEENRVGMEEELMRTKEELHTTRIEVMSLRRELMDCLSQLQRPGDKGTQTTPRDSLEEERARLERQREALSLEKLKLEAERSWLQQEKDRLGRSATLEPHRSKSSPNLVQTEDAPDATKVSRAASNMADSLGHVDHATCRGEIDRLQQKIVYLEKQLENTENALKTNQNLVSENSRRLYEQSTQILQLRQAVSQANIVGDQLRLKLDKKDDLIRRTIDDKNELYNKLSASKDKIAALNLELTAVREKMAALLEEKTDLEQKARLEREDLDRREKRASEKEREMDRFREERSKSEDSSKQLSSENSSLREERKRLSTELEKTRSENRERMSEVAQLRLELQQYITEVRRIEDVLMEREEERKKLLRQYEDLSREIHETETVNRSLEMQAANLEIEVKAKQTDLEAAKSRCESLEKYVEEILRQNEHFRTQIITLNAKVDMLTSDLQDNRIARDSVLTDLDGVNELAVKLNTDKVDLLHRISDQNAEVENLQMELVKLREELLSAMATLEDEKHRARSLQNLLTTSSTHTTETRETVIREVEGEKLQTQKYSQTYDST